MSAQLSSQNGFEKSSFNASLAKPAETARAPFETRMHRISGRDLPGRSSHARILIDASREFSLQKRPEKTDVDHYKELFYQFVDRLDKSDRRLISAMLARSAFTPRAVALYFAQDALEVAAPFLLFSPVLNDMDLRAIAGKCGKIYADVIKKRQLPMEPFTARKLDEAPLERLEPASVATRQNVSVTRPAAGTNPHDEIVALAGIGGRLGRKATPNDPLPEHATAIPVSPQSTMPDERPAEPSRVFKLPKKEMRALLAAARMQHRQTFAKLVEELSGLESSTTLKLLSMQTGDEILYLIKALGVPSPHDIQMAMMATPRIGRGIESYRHAKKTLAELDPGICRMIFNEIGARFDLGMRPQSAPQTENSNSELTTPDIRQAMQNRRRSLIEEYRPGQNRSHQTQHDKNGLSGIAPMSRWPGSEAGLREAV